MTEIQFVHDNIMWVDGKYLVLDKARASRENFARLMPIVKPLIVNQLEVLYFNTLVRNPDAEVGIGSIWLGRFAITNIDLALTDSGLYSRYKTQRSRGVFTDADNFKNNTFIQEYWASVAFNGLKPEVRQASSSNAKTKLHLLATVLPNDN